MLSIFTLTYAFRFLGDYFIVPLALSEKHLAICKLESGVEGVCVSALFSYYYVWSSMLYDFLPLLLIAMFHYRSFR